MAVRGRYFSELLPHGALGPAGALFLRALFSLCGIAAASVRCCWCVASWAQGLSPRPRPPRRFRKCVFGRRGFPIATALYYYSVCNFSRPVSIGPRFPKKEDVFRPGGTFSGRETFSSRGADVKAFSGRAKRFPVGGSMRNVFRSAETFFGRAKRFPVGADAETFPGR